MKSGSGVVTQCRACGAEVDAGLVSCPECGGCCPSCTTTGLQVRRASSPQRREAMARSTPCGKLMAMHDELGHALMEAMWELDNLPQDVDEAISRIFAVTDDLEDAVKRTRRLDELIED